MRGSDECGRTIAVTTSADTKDLGLLCAGEDTFDTGANGVAYILVNDKPCYPDEVTEVVLNGGSTGHVSADYVAGMLVYYIEE